MPVMRVCALAVALLSATRADAGQCCFANNNDCDGETSFCSKDAKHCTDCGGHFQETSSEAPACEGTAMCCYSDDKDCDMGKHWCSSSAGRCSDCGGSFVCLKAEEKAEDEEPSKADEEPSKAKPVMLAAMPAAKPLMLASAPGLCCYSGPKDCDGARDYCSKDATHCDTCKGTFYNATELDLAAVAEPLMLAAEVPKKADETSMEVPGTCCYTGHKDCDGTRDWCSKDGSHCKACGGTFYAINEAAPSKDTAVAQMAALPVQLAAAPAANVQQADTREQRPEQGEQPQQPFQGGQKAGDWERYIPKEYRNFFKTKMEDARASRNHTEASTKASAFLGVPQESITSDPLSLPALACLSVAGLAIMFAAVKANRRTVNLHTEVLG